MSPLTYPIGKEFKPVPAYRTYLYTSLLISVVVLILPWLIPAVIFTPRVVGLGLAIPTVAVIIFVAWWIPLYCESIRSWGLSGKAAPLQPKANPKGRQSSVRWWRNCGLSGTCLRPDRGDKRGKGGGGPAYLPLSFPRLMTRTG